MVLAFDAASSGNVNADSATSVCTVSHTCSGSNRVLIVDAIIGSPASIGVNTTATYNGVAMTSLGKIGSNGTTAGHVEKFVLINPDSGTNNIVVTRTGGSTDAFTIIVGGKSYNGASQTLADYTGTDVTAAGASSPATVDTGTTAATSIVDDAVCCGAIIGTIGAGQTERWIQNVNGGSGGGNARGSTEPGTGGAVTMSHTVTDWWGIVAVEVKAAADATPPPAFDATSGTAALVNTATTATWTHTPVGTPRGVVVLIPQGVQTDQVSGVTYGGVAMTRVRLDARATAETCASYVYFLGKDIPTGAQTVAVTSTGTNPKWPQVITITASGDTEIDVQSGGDAGIIANPSVAIIPTAPAVVAYVNASGLNAPVSTPETNTIQAAARDLGTISGHIGYKAVAAAGATTIGWTSASDDVCHAAVSIIETISKAPKVFVGASPAAQKASRW
jgi:hypothetical protein